MTRKQRAAVFQPEFIEDLRYWVETAHLLRSPANAERLITALGRALRDEGKSLDLETLRQDVNLD